MNKIKFSHNYPKLWNQEEAILLAVLKIDSCEFNEDLIEYDTKNCEGNYYPLKTGKYIQLIFLGNKRIPFCTIRSYNSDKFRYYISLLNQKFRIEN